MKITLVCALVCLLATSARLFAQTNTISTVMVDSNGYIYRPSNFWSANADDIIALLPSNNAPELNVDFARTLTTSRFATTFAGVPTVTTNVSIGNEPGWFHMYSLATNATASGRVLLMRYVFAGESSGAGLNFGQVNYRFVVDLGVNVVSSNNVFRFTVGTTMNDYGNPLSSSGIGFEINTHSNTNSIRLICHDGTSGSESGWVSLGYFQRTVVVLESQTNGQVTLSTVQGASGSMPIVRTNISNGPTQAIGAGNSTLGAGLFISTTNSGSRSFSVYGVAAQIAE